MAGYNFYPQAYPNPYLQPSVYQYPQQPAQLPQPNQMQPAQSGIIWVGGEPEAQNYPVAPNNAVALWDSAKPTIYLKQADASGKPSIKIYDLTERPENGKIQAPASDRDAGIAGKELKREIREIWAALEEIKEEIKAGKTRNNKKLEVTDDDAE